MSKITLDTTDMAAIGDAIRTKLDVETPYKASEMPAAIQSIPSGGGDVDPPLPSEYQEVEYLTFSGQEFILVENLPESYLLHVLFSVADNTSEYVAVAYREAYNMPYDFELRSNRGTFGLWIRNANYGYVYTPAFPSGTATSAASPKEIIASLTQPQKNFLLENTARKAPLIF